MPRILRSQGIYKLGKPIPAAPVVFIAPPIQTRLVAVATARGSVGRYPSKGWAPWATVCNQVVTPVLDNFNRPDEGPPPSASWSAPIDDPSRLQVSGNQCTSSGTAGQYGSAYWNQAQFGPDSGVFCTLGAVLNTDLFLYARLTTPGAGTTNGYAVEFHAPSNFWRIWKVTAGVYVGLTANTTPAVAFAVGDVVGFTVVGTTITVYQNGVAIGSVTDGTWSSAGSVGVSLSAGGLIDAFRGGGAAAMGGQRAPIMGLRPPAVICPAEQPTPPLRVRLAAGRRPVTRSRLFPPTTAAVFAAPPAKARTVRTRPRDTTYVLGRPATLQVFAGPKSELTKTRPRPTTHLLRPAQVVLNPQVERQLRTLRVALVRGRPGRTRTYLRPPAVVTAAVVFVAPPIRVLNVHTRPRRTQATLRPPATLQVFSGPRSSLTKTRPRPTVHVLRPAAVVLVPSVELREETIRVALVRGRAGKTDYRLQPPTVVNAAAVFTGPTSRLVRIRPRDTVLRLFPPAVVAPRPLAPPVQTRLVRTRPRHTIYRLQAPTVLAVFAGPRSELTKARPQPTTTVLVPAQVVRVPSVELAEETLRVRLVQTRPRPTTTLLRPPAVVLTPIPPEVDIHVVLADQRRPVAKSKLFRPATLEPFSIQLREQTIRVRLVQIRPRHTTLKLRPPTVLAVLRFYTGKPVLVRTRPRDTVATLRGPVVLRTFSTGESRLVVTRPRRTTTVLRPPAVVRQRPQVTQIRSALVRTRPRHTVTALRPPVALRVFAGPAVHLTRVRPRHTIARLYAPAVVTPFVAPVSTFIRVVLQKIRPRHTLAQLFPPRRLKNVPGTACLTDQLANQACLTDQLADVACLTDEEGMTEACLTDQPAAVACLVDLSAAHATLRDEE